MPARFRSEIQANLIAIVGTAAVVLIRCALSPILGTKAPFSLLYAVIALVVWLGGYRPAVFATAFGFLAMLYFYVEPYYTFRIVHTSDWIIAFLYLVTAAIITGLGETVRVFERRNLEERELLHATLNSIGDAVIATDNNLRIKSMNPVAEALTGWTATDASGLPLSAVFNIIEERTRRPVDNLATKALQDGVALGQKNHTVLIGKDSKELPIDAKTAPIRRQDGATIGCVLVFHDMTERRLAEARNEQIVATLNGLTVGYWELSPDWQIVFVNAEGADTAEQEPSALVGKNFWDVFPMLVGTKVELEYRLVASKRVVADFDYCFESLNRWFQIKVSPTPQGGLVVLSREITAEKQAEATVRLQTVKIKRLVDANILGVIFADKERIVEANDAFLQMVGYDRADLEAGRLNWRKMTPPEYVSADDKALAELQQHGVCAPFEKEYFRKDGSRVFILIGPAVIDPKIPSFVCFVQDISQVKEAERQLREADRRKDEFLATLAHELRNPLAPIRTAVDLLGTMECADPAFPDVREMVERQVTHMVRLVDDLLEVSRITSGKIELQREHFDLRRAVKNAVETSDRFIKAGRHELSVSLPPDPLFVDGDEVRLTQVVTNVLHNAAKFTPESGHIRLTVERQNEVAVVIIRDDGVGISPEMLPKIFDLFTQVKGAAGKSKGGMGIGLALAKRLVEMHGGTIAARSEGQGTEFTIRLPLLAVTTEKETPQSASDRTDGHSHHRILVVDDNVDAARGLSVLLNRKGHAVDLAFDGPSGIEHAKEFKPDMILLDLGMPGMDGFETAKRLRALPQTKDITLVALTGWGQQEDRQRTLKAGFSRHLVKPVAPAALEELLDTIPT